MERNNYETLKEVSGIRNKFGIKREVNKTDSKEVSELDDIKFNSCSHRLTRYFCECQQRVYNNRKINPRDYCKYLLRTLQKSTIR